MENWIKHFATVYGYSLGAAFERYTRLRAYYLTEDNKQGAQTIENLIKNDVGVRRLRQECPHYFDEKNKGRSVEFYQGKFLGWTDELKFDPTLRAVSVYEI